MTARALLHTDRIQQSPAEFLAAQGTVFARLGAPEQDSGNLIVQVPKLLDESATACLPAARDLQAGDDPLRFDPTPPDRLPCSSP